MNPTTDPIYRQNPTGTVVTDRLTDPLKEKCIVICARTILWSRQQN